MPPRAGYASEGGRPTPAPAPKAADVAMELKEALNLKPLPTEPKPTSKTVTLWQAAARGDVDRLQEYIANKGPTNEKDAYKMSLLHHAVHGKQLEITRMLLDNEADIDAQDAEGWSPLQYAVDKDCTEIVELLVSRGADTSAKDTYKRTLLHIAARIGNASVVELLRDEGGCAVGAKTVVGFTALHYAAQEGHLEAVKALKPTKTHLAVADLSGKVAAQLARDAGHTATAEYLESLAARRAMAFDQQPPISYVPAGHAAPPGPPGMPCSVSPVRDMGLPAYLPGTPAAMVRDASAPNTEALLGVMRNVTQTDEIIALKAEVARLFKRLTDEEAGHADALRKGQDSLKTVRTAYEKRVEELQAELTDVKAAAAREREVYMERIENAQVEHMQALQAERRLGEERVQRMGSDSTEALNAVQDQMAELNATLEAERKKQQASVIALVEAKKSIEAGQDEIESLRREIARMKDTARQREGREAGRQRELDATAVQHVEEIGRLKVQITQLNRSMRDLDDKLVVEKKCREAAELQCLKAEKLVQEASSNATTSELRLIESQREVAVMNRELLAKDHQLTTERDRLNATESHLQTEMSCRKFAERFSTAHSALSNTYAQHSPLMPYASNAYSGVAASPVIPNAYLHHTLDVAGRSPSKSMSLT